jgi:hypothetical protein
MHIATDPTRRAAASAAAAAALLGALAGCGPLKSYFPSRDEVFKPVPVSLGEERIAGGDTSYVLTGRGYRVVAHDRDLLPDAKTSLDRAAFAFRRFMSVEPPTVDVRLLVASRRDRARGDTARKAAAPADTSGRVVTMFAWRDDRGGRRGGPGGASGSSVPAVALVRSWLSVMTDSLTHTPPAPRTPVATVADTSSRRGGSPRGFDARPADDPRLPSWIQQAIPALVAGYPDPELASAQLARQKDKLIPLRTLLTERRPGSDRDRSEALAGGGGGGADRSAERGDERDGERRGRVGGAPGRGPGGRTAALQGAPLFDAQAVSVAAYLAEREGSEFVGTVFRTLAGGGTFEDALRNAHSVAHDLDGFEQGWRGWLDAEAGKVEDRYRQ